MGDHPDVAFCRSDLCLYRQCGNRPDGRARRTRDLQEAEDEPRGDDPLHRGLLQPAGRGDPGRRHDLHHARRLREHEFHELLLDERTPRHLLRGRARRARDGADHDVPVPQGQTPGLIYGEDTGQQL